MPKALKRYLLITGVGAFVALAQPDVVLLGLFLLVIPGLILGFAPTAFLWGCVFALAWSLLKNVVAPRLAISGSLAVTAALMFAIPWSSRYAGQELLETSVLPEISPAEPLKPSGDIRLDIRTRPDNKNPTVQGSIRAFSCDNLCVALLFMPGVKSVTVNDSYPFTTEQHRAGEGGLATGSRTYRLALKPQCGGREIQPDIGGQVGLFGKTLEENRAIEAEWNLRLSSESCIVAEPPLSTWDLMFREGEYSYPGTKHASVGPWSLGAPRARINYVEIRDGEGNLTLRRLTNRVSVLAQPFSISPSGGLENFHFGWSRSTLSSATRAGDADLIAVLKAHSTVAARPPSPDLLPQIRTRLQHAVADPALAPGDPAFAILETYFAGIAAKPLSDTDLALVRSLILDDRITSYPGLHHLNKVPADHHRQIRAAIVRRVLTTARVQELARGSVDNVLAASPAGAFAKLSRDEQLLLASPDRRIAAAGLIARLSDAGTEAVPLLVDILRHHGAALNAALASKENDTDRSARIGAHAPVIDAARAAFCRLGHVASRALPQVEGMIASGVIPAYSLTGHQGSDWNLTLVRLGKELDTIRKPESLSGSEAGHRRNIEDKLRRFDPDRSCGRF